ncbi:MAG: hypothetical protein ABIH29_03760 [Candidatus Micrarchaeota archaeon]
MDSKRILVPLKKAAITAAMALTLVSACTVRSCSGQSPPALSRTAPLQENIMRFERSGVSAAPPNPRDGDSRNAQDEEEMEKDCDLFSEPDGSISISCITVPRRQNHADDVDFGDDSEFDIEDENQETVDESDFAINDSLDLELPGDDGPEDRDVEADSGM